MPSSIPVDTASIFLLCVCVYFILFFLFNHTYTIDVTPHPDAERWHSPSVGQLPVEAGYNHLQVRTRVAETWNPTNNDTYIVIEEKKTSAPHAVPFTQ